MSAAASPAVLEGGDMGQRWAWLRGRVLGENRGIALAIGVNLGLLLGAVAALPFDHRQILGINAWVKPIKFDVSVIVYLATVAVLLALLKGWKRARVSIGWGIGVAMIVENAVISMQSFRGVRSHMNYTSAFDGIAFGVMGVFIVVNTVLVAWLLVLYFASRTELPAALVWGIRLGLVAVLAGSIEGALMVAHGAHTVGAADGLAGLPFVNWSRGHGDLRVAHFFALHALQLLPLAGWGIARTAWGTRAQVAGIFGVFVAYLAMVAGLFAQAMDGRPVVP